MNLKESPINEEDFRAVVRILGDIAEMNTGTNDKRNHLMRELGGLIDVDTWLWGVAPMLEPGEQPVYLFLNSSDMSNDRMAIILKAIEHLEAGAMSARLTGEMIAANGHIIPLRQDVVDDEWFLNSAAHPILKEANVGPILFSIHPRPGQGISVAGFYRPFDAPLFTPREARIAHIILSEMTWLHESRIPHATDLPMPGLPPRCRLVLNQLVIGRSRAQIAADLAISIHTANDYAKRIFQHFRVHSQTQLIAKLRHGDGLDIQIPSAKTHS